jgi:hypothetical protein
MASGGRLVLGRSTKGDRATLGRPPVFASMRPLSPDSGYSVRLVLEGRHVLH